MPCRVGVPPAPIVDKGLMHTIGSYTLGGGFNPNPRWTIEKRHLVVFSPEPAGQNDKKPDWEFSRSAWGQRGHTLVNVLSHEISLVHLEATVGRDAQTRVSFTVTILGATLAFPHNSILSRETPVSQVTVRNTRSPRVNRHRLCRHCSRAI